MLLHVISSTEHLCHMHNTHTRTHTQRLTSHHACMNLCHNQRRLAVKRHFPRLAYVSSDVVVFISRETFANAQFLERPKAFARAATRGLTNHLKPTLFLVQNQCDEKDSAREEDLSKLHATWGEELEPYYENVLFIRLPSFRVFGQSCFAAKVGVLADTLATQLLSQEDDRKKSGTYFPRTTWWQMYEPFHSECSLLCAHSAV